MLHVRMEAGRDSCMKINKVQITLKEWYENESEERNYGHEFADMTFNGPMAEADWLAINAVLEALKQRVAETAG